MTYRQVITILEENGFYFERYGKGSHRVYQAHHSGKRWSVILSFGRPGEDVKPGTLSAIMRQSGLSRDVFRR
jgi:predicted RNA binding protein YcfA (HicA-like mRNA interferase family)